MRTDNRVLLLIDQLGSGGAERQLSYLAINLRKAGYEVRLMRFYPGKIFYEADLERAGIVPEIFDKGRPALRRPFAVASLVRQWKPTAVIAYLDGTAMGCCLARTLTPFNLIVSERNTTQSLTAKERIKFMLYHMADHIVPNSFSQGKFIGDTYPQLSTKVKVINNMIDLDKFHPADKRPARQRVLTTARIAPQKNVLTYLDALAILKAKGIKARFDWFGSAEQTYLNTVLAHRSELGLDDYIEFHVGGTENIAEEYRASTHFCLPSAYEGFANALCEAMASGLVCTASRVSDNPRILADDSMLFNHTDPADIASKIKRSLELSPDRQRTIATSHRKHIAQLCSADSFVRAYTSLFRQTKA